MDPKTCVIEARVLGHWLIQRFSGEAILASADPRFVVALLIKNTACPYIDKDTGVAFAAHKVSFFAIGSVTRVFGESDVIGKEFRLAVRQDEIGGRKVYAIALAE